MPSLANVIDINRNKKPLVIDNFLGKQTFQEMQNRMLGSDFNWFYNNAIDRPEDVNKFQFTHIFYKDNVGINSGEYSSIVSILDKLDIKNTIRIKANLLTRTLDIVKNDFHIDIEFIGGQKFLNSPTRTSDISKYTTAIFYMNTNNGYTEFEDGSIVESVENRMVIFSSEISHRGTSCTDDNIRVVINFNYII